MTVEIAINGANGTASLRDLTFVIIKKTATIPPKIKDKLIIVNIPLKPDKTPKAEISLISPPPIPPFEMTAISHKIKKDISIPVMESKISPM